MKSPIIFLITLIAFVLLNIFDGHSTYQVVKKSNLKSERNPIARFFFRKMGIIRGMIFLKMISVILIPLMYWTFKEEPKSMNSLLIIIDLLYLAVVMNNYRISKKLS